MRRKPPLANHLQPPAIKAVKRKMNLRPTHIARKNHLYLQSRDI